MPDLGITQNNIIPGNVEATFKSIIMGEQNYKEVLQAEREHIASHAYRTVSKTIKRPDIRRVTEVDEASSPIDLESIASLNKSQKFNESNDDAENKLQVSAQVSAQAS